MYLNALEFLEEERDAWRPFEALAGLSDDALDVTVEGAHGWSGRDLIGHLVAGQMWALDVAHELAMGTESPSKARFDAEWDAGGDAMNERITNEWRALPIDEVRRRLSETPGELRGYLTVVPETRWLKHSENLRYFLEETIEHYADHVADLDAILDAAR